MTGEQPRKSQRPKPGANDALVGGIVVLVMVIATLISFSASTGLPFVPTYKVTVELPDAGRLNVGAPVRVGGARVGVVKQVEAIPSTSTQHATAKVRLAIDPDLGPLPVDSRVRLRPMSILGGKYLSLELGRSDVKLKGEQPLPLSQADKTVDIDQALRIFEPRTRKALQGVVSGFAEGVAGRGAGLNSAIGHFAHAIEPLNRVATTLADDDTGLSRFIGASARLAAALAPVGDELAGLLRHAGPTFAAFRGTDDSLKPLVEEGPETARTITPALQEITPVLHDATIVTAGLAKGTTRLDRVTRSLDRSLNAARPVLARTPQLSVRLQRLLKSVYGLATDRTTIPALKNLRDLSDATLPLFTKVEVAQRVCNVVALLGRNLASARSQGDVNAPFPRITLMAYEPQTLQVAEPDSDLHFNPYPIEDESECESGNERYEPGLHIGNTAAKEPAQAEMTTAPAEATARARAAGLLDENPQGTR